MPAWDLVLRDAHIATMQEGDVAYGTVENGAIGIAEGKIAWVGPESDLPAWRQLQVAVTQWPMAHPGINRLSHTPRVRR